MKNKTMIKDLAAVILCSFTISNLTVGNVAAQNGDSNEDKLFAASFEDLMSRANTVTHDYDIQYEKWKRGEYSNATMVSITDTHLPKFQEVISIAKNLSAPAKFENVTKLYLKSLEAERQSDISFRNSLVSGNATEAMLSSKLLSDALKYELESFAAFKLAAAETDK